MPHTATLERHTAAIEDLYAAARRATNALGAAYAAADDPHPNPLTVDELYEVATSADESIVAAFYRLRAVPTDVLEAIDAHLAAEPVGQPGHATGHGAEYARDLVLEELAGRVDHAERYPHDEHVGAESDHLDRWQLEQ